MGFDKAVSIGNPRRAQFTLERLNLAKRIVKFTPRGHIELLSENGSHLLHLLAVCEIGANKRACRRHAVKTQHTDLRGT